MEFINTLTDPTVIASTLISIVIYLISPVFDRFRNTIILFASKMPSVVRSALRRQKAKTLKKIKQQRQNGDLVTFESAKSHAYLVLFFGSLAAFWWLMILGGANLQHRTPTFSGSICSTGHPLSVDKTEQDTQPKVKAIYAR